MADAMKHPPGSSLASELVDLISVLRTRKTRVFAGGFVLTFVACTFFIAFNPTYGSSSSPWLNSIVSSTAPVRSQFNSFFSSIFSNSSSSGKVWGFGSSPPPPSPSPSPPPRSYLSNATSGGSPSVALLPPSQMNRTGAAAESVAVQPPPPPLEEKNATESGGTPKKESIAVNPGDSNFSVSLGEKADTVAGLAAENRNWSIKSLVGCDIFHGKWVEDASYPMYKPGSCPHIDESFNCHRNGRPDSKYEKLRWQPFGCSIPRLNGKDMLERLRGRRLVYVGDSLNRNMWESLICILRNSVGDKSRVFEASGRREFKSEGSYSFIFKDYNCSVEFYRSPFLVQEWEMPESGGKKKETLRLDIIEKSSSKYKDADVIVFNTGHWWTHEKTSKGRDYYQVGNQVYGQLKVIDAFHKALVTWARWVDSNIDPRRTLVFFRGYSASHFSGGKWNSGGQCDHETEPIKNESYITFYPPKMSVLESVIHDMKVPVGYLNITTMTDYRKDAHPSIYRKKRATAAGGRELDKYQDCSHWCLPGVPDSWNELLYAQILLKFSLKLG